MKINSNEIINVGDVSTSGHLRLDAMFNIFQKMAVLHTHTVGFEINDLLDSGKTWVLNRVLVQIEQLPRLEDSVEINTWSRKIQRFKGVRDFEICVNGNRIISASSLWVYLDIDKGKPVRVPADYEARYGIVEEQSTTVDVEGIQYNKITNPDYALTIATRISDYDINGHVNNAVMLQYIETGMNRYCACHGIVEEIRLIFIREISLEIDEVNVRLQKTVNGCLFDIESDNVVFAGGEASLRNPA